MLTLSSDATEAIEQILEAPEVPDGGGLRIAPSGPSADGDGPAGGGLQLSVAAEPDTGDEVIEDQGARVFVDGDVSPFLDDKQLDVAVDGETLQFRLGDQA
ncbi:MAG: iron-sulfur cluster biosynthesis family protein [Solirubrobacteraceae bacterium]|jgi:Fe-S cluster assembly iron-binding protein IscA